VGDGGDQGVMRHTDNAGKVRGKSVQRRRTQRHGSPRGGDDGGALVKTSQAAVERTNGSEKE
jgi:hypothetical protein